MLMLGERGASPEIYQALKAEMKLDRPWLEQYAEFMRNAVRGDLGQSIVSKQSVLREFSDHLTATLELSLIAFILAMLIGIPIGILAARFRHTWIDRLLMGGVLIGYSMPIFWLGLMAILVFSVHLGLLPVSGRLAAEFEIQYRTGFYLIDSWFSDDGARTFASALRHLILPAAVLSTIPLAAVARMTRASLIEVLSLDYIRTARSKGLSESRVLGVHALRNALIPIVTMMGLMLGTLLTGAVLTETLFSWPGLGYWLVKSVAARDYPVIQGALLLMSLLILVLNMGVDILSLLISPQLRDEGH